MEIKAFALGGLDELGKVCFVVEVQEEIYIFDAGLKYFNNIDLGNNVIIPNFDYLIKNKDRIKGIFITKIDISDAYAIKYLIKKIKNITIYTSEINKNLMADIGLLSSAEVIKNVKIIQDHYVKIGNNQVKKFNTASNLPGSCGFSIKTRDGLIIYTGSFIIETNKEKEIFNTNYKKISRDEKVLLLISNVSNINTDGFGVTKSRIDNWLDNSLDETKENLYICCYDNEWYKIHNIIKKLFKNKDKFNISFFDKKFFNFYFNTLKNIDPIYNSIDFINFEDIKRSETKRNIILLTGDQKWLFSRIKRIILQTNPEVRLTDKDFVLLLGENKFNMELSIFNILNELHRTDSKIKFVSQKEIIPTEAGTEDLRFLCNQLEPKYFIPFNAYYKEICKAKDKISTCLNEEQIIIINNGDVVIFKNGNKQKKMENIKSESVFINTSTFDIVPASILNERQILGTYGVVFISFGFNLNNMKYSILTNIEIDFIGINSNEKKLLKIKNEIIKSIKFLFENKLKEIKIPKNINILVKKLSEKIIKKELNKYPFIISMIVNM